MAITPKLSPKQDTRSQVQNAQLSNQPRHVKSTLPLACLALLAIGATGCINVRTHSSFDPIYLNLTIDLKVQLQKELDSVFGDIDAASTTVNETE